MPEEPPAGRLGARAGSLRQHARRARRLAQVRVGGVHHVLRPGVAVADGDVQVVHRGGLEQLQRALEHLLRSVQPVLAERLGQRRAAGVQVLLALLQRHVAADARARLAGDGEALPGRGGRAVARGDDLDLVAVLQLGAQRQDAAVDLGPDAGVADLAVHGVGEIHRRGAARQRDQPALRREAEHLVLIQLELGVLEEFVAGGGVVEDLQQVFHPGEAAAILRAGDALLVAPMRGNAVIGHALHLGSADLHLDLLVDADGAA